MRRVADTGPGALTSSRRPVEHLAAVAELPRKCPHRLLPSPTIGAEQSAGWHSERHEDECDDGQRGHQPLSVVPSVSFRHKPDRTRYR